MKHTVASLEVRIAALEASFAERSAQTKQFIAEFAALRAQSDALAARSTAPAAPAAANAAPRAKHVVHIARTENGGWAVWLDYKLHSTYPTFKAGSEACRQLQLSFKEEAEACAQ